MLRAWLILGDIVVILLFLGSFTLFYLSLPIKEQVSVEQQIVSSKLPVVQKPLSPLVLKEEKRENSEMMSVEEFMRMAQQESSVALTPVSVWRDVPLSESLSLAHATIGDGIFIRIFKEESLMEIWIKSDSVYHFLKAYQICAYSGRLGPKRKEGDRQAPEGFYRVGRKSLNPHSKFHLSFNLGYPNAYDRAHHRTGSYLMVHRDCRSIGCYAMTNGRIKEIYGLVSAALKQGQPYVPVHIFPFKMENGTMAEYSESRWYDFWMVLKEGYDYFEAEELPPYVTVEKGEYVISETRD